MFEHYSVLNKETVAGVLNDNSGTYVDGTLGGGGHVKTLLKELNEDAKVYAFDQDINAINNAKSNIKDLRFTPVHSNFIHLKKELEGYGINKINGLILDLGFSSPQIDDPTRGFSYMHDGPLDMRMDIRQDLKAFDIINEYSFNDLMYIFNKYGEEKYSKFIVEGIIKVREEKKIETTLELVEIIDNSIPYKFKNKIKGHSAKKVFQALRIEVNNELKVLDEILDIAFDLLEDKGRLSIITFHSLEDKIVKYKFRKYSEVGDELKNLPIIPKEFQPKGRLVNNKPILPTNEEIIENSRSKSAKLRVVEKNEIN